MTCTPMHKTDGPNGHPLSCLPRPPASVQTVPGTDQDDAQQTHYPVCAQPQGDRDAPGNGKAGERSCKAHVRAAWQLCAADKKACMPLSRQSCLHRAKKCLLSHIFGNLPFLCHTHIGRSMVGDHDCLHNCWHVRNPIPPQCLSTGLCADPCRGRDQGAADAAGIRDPGALCGAAVIARAACGKDKGDPQGHGGGD